MAKYKVPEDGLQAARSAYGAAQSHNIEPILEVFIRWQSENPVVPGDEQCKAMQKAYADRRFMGPLTTLNIYEICCVEFQRIMYLAPEPEVPEAVKDLIPAFGTAHRDEWAETLTEAYRRGKSEGR